MSIFEIVDRIGMVLEPRCNLQEPSRLLREFFLASRGRNIRISRLEPKSRDRAVGSSLSSRYGLEFFPVHTDYATEAIPPKYIGLFCPVRRDAETNIFKAEDISGTLGSAANSALFRVLKNQGKFSTRFKSSAKIGTIYRYNSDCMTPLNAEAHRVVAHFQSNLMPTTVINWSATTMVIFDNWNNLHSRGRLNTCGGWLWRIAVWS